MACIGLRDETESVRPLAMCQQCQHWQAGSGPVIRPHAIVILRDGYIEQEGSPLEVYDKPANLFVAEFIGSPSMNLLKGEIGRAHV